MQNDNNDQVFDRETVSKLQIDLNRNYSTELAELVEMTFGPKPEAELQRLISAEVIDIDSSGIRLFCRYHRWETAEKNDRMFCEHTDETSRTYRIPYSSQVRSKEELFSVINQMIQDAKTSYLKGFE